MKYILSILFIILSFSVFSQNRFPSVDSAKNYVLRYVKNSAVESFTNWRMQNVNYGTLELLDSLVGNGAIDSIWKTGDTLKYSKGGVNYTIGTVGGTDTTSLSNRIDARVVIGSDASLRSLTITGTNGNGHIHLRHQASLPTATGQSTVIYANNSGDFAYKNDGNYHTIFATSANTANRTYTFQNKSYTVADNADVVKYTDTSSMLSPYLRSNVAAATYQLILDTIPLAAFGAGSGAAGDTLAFSTSAVYGSFYNAGNDTLIITQMRAGVLGTSPSITTEVYWNDSLNITAGATILVTGGTSVTGTIGATNVTSFTNSKIPPNVWVFVRTSAVATKPTYFTLTLLGYRKRQ